MIWTGINIEARIDVLFINGGSLTADRYITDILEDQSLSAFRALHPR